MADPKRKNTGPSKNTVEAKKADAAAKAAEAEAAKAATEVKRLELDAQARRDARMDKRREDDASIGNQVRQLALVAGPLAVGMLYGKAQANKIADQSAVAAQAKNKQLDKVATKLRGVSDPAKLRAGVRTVDKLKLTNVKGPIGAVTAGFLLTEAVVARVVAANTENETASEVLNGAGLGLGAAAVSTIGTRMVQQATSNLLPNAGSMMDVESAREKMHKGAKPPKLGPAAKIAAASKIVLPIVAGMAAYAVFSDRANAGESTSTAVVAGGKAAGDVFSGGAFSEFDQAKARGAGDVEAASIAAFKGGVNLATFGVADLADQSLRDSGHGGVAAAITNTVLTAFGFGKPADGKAYLNSAAEKAATMPAPIAAPAMVTGAMQPKSSDGQTAGYSRRTSTGLTVQVGGYRTPTR